MAPADKCVSGGQEVYVVYFKIYSEAQHNLTSYLLPMYRMKTLTSIQEVSDL